jgi:hypothetical protein
MSTILFSNKYVTIIFLSLLKIYDMYILAETLSFKEILSLFCRSFTTDLTLRIGFQAMNNQN